MAVQQIDIEQFLQLAEDHPVFDVRSPSEYGHAHIPGALPLPLFSDEERKEVGTAYKQKSREAAIKIGLDYFGVKMRQMVCLVEDILHHKGTKTVLVHCWRGGMRSGAVSWLLDMYGFEVYTLRGGYKNYRNWVLDQFSRPYSLRILSGYTGSGKTEILSEMARLGAPTVDLEGLAGHRGSAFGALGLPPQPSVEQFENKLAIELYTVSRKYPDKTIWLESESNRIGNVNIFHTFFNQMKTAPRVHVEVSLAARLDYITMGYGNFDREQLKAAVSRIQKRLGGLETKNTLSHLDAGRIRDAFEILLRYYDKFYGSGGIYLPAVMTIELIGINAHENAQLILQKTKDL